MLTLEDFLAPSAESISCHYPRGRVFADAEDTYCLTFSSGEKRHATRSELDVIDSRLASVIDTLVIINLPGSIPELVAATLRHWSHPQIESSRQGNGARHYFSRIHAIDMPTPQSIDFFADTYMMRSQRPGLVIAAMSGRGNTYTLSAKDLEGQYPGSVERLQMGLSIGMRVEDLVVQIISNAPAEDLASPLPDLAPR